MRTLLSSVVMATLLLASFNAFAQEQAQAPVYKEGDSWRFRLGKRPVQATIKDGKVQFSAAESSQGGELGEQQMERLKAMLAVEKDDREFLQFPLSVGKVWNSPYQEHNKGSGLTNSVSARSSVTGIEQVTTAAGTFRTFKIERVETFSTGRSTTAGMTTRRRYYTNYYSPETGSLVKSVFEAPDGNKSEVELVKFAAGN